MFGARWHVVSQIPGIASPGKRAYAEAYWLPELIRAWRNVEKVTGYRWRSTSYWRFSPSHKNGYALDIAPDIGPNSYHLYAANRGSDPVLYKREKLIRDLQQLNNLGETSPFNIGIYIEPDHLHMHVLQKEVPQVYRIFKWKVPKPVYKDSNSRIQLPLIRTQ